MLSVSGSRKARQQLLDVATRFSRGGCCGKRPEVTPLDLDLLGVTPLPRTFLSSLGLIMPASGWKALCVFIYESLADGPFPAQETKKRDAGEVVADLIRKQVRDSSSRPVR